MSLIFRDSSEVSDFMRGADLILLNRDKETVLDSMEDFDIEERIAIINEIMNTQPISTNLKNLIITNEPCKSIFGFPVFDCINSYKSRRYKLTINCSLQ